MEGEGEGGLLEKWFWTRQLKVGMVNSPGRWSLSPCGLGEGGGVRNNFIYLSL